MSKYLELVRKYKADNASVSLDELRANAFQAECATADDNDSSEYDIAMRYDIADVCYNAYAEAYVKTL